MAEFGEFLLAQKGPGQQGASQDIDVGHIRSRPETASGLLQAWKSMVKLSTGQGVRPLRATDAVPFAAGVRLSMHTNTKRVLESLATRGSTRSERLAVAAALAVVLVAANSLHRSVCPRSRFLLQSPGLLVHLSMFQ